MDPQQANVGFDDDDFKYAQVNHLQKNATVSQAPIAGDRSEMIRASQNEIPISDHRATMGKVKQ